MPSFRNTANVPWLFVLLTMAGCVTTDYPRNLPEAKTAAEMTTGHWIVMYMKADTVGHGRLPLEGELISVERDSVFLFAGDRFTARAKQDVRTATVFVSDYAIDPSQANTWMFLGLLSTLSHGALLIISAPVWLLLGGLSVSAIMDDADQGDVRWPGNSWETLAAFARFPQGLSRQIDRASLRPAAGKIAPPKRTG